MRGEAPAGDTEIVGGGIIPAGAGRSEVGFGAFESEGDHPRGCGEKLAYPPPATTRPGSSPRVRGEVRHPRIPRNLKGIIPAGAGRSGEVCSKRIHRWDHPRGCGEKLSAQHVSAKWRGSSPRVRGEAGGLLFALAVDGIIPAGAGRSETDGSTHRFVRDHPRGCGEKEVLTVEDGARAGSSPRVRGEDQWQIFAPTWTGIIPAGAGRR